LNDTSEHLHLEVLRQRLESAQYTAIRYSNRLTDVRAVASIGSVGDSYDCEYPQAGDPRLGGSPQPLLLAV